MELPVQNNIFAQDAASGAPAKTMLRVEKKDVAAALVSYAVAFAYTELVVMRELAFGYAAFVCLFLLAIEAYCIASKRGRANGESRFFALCLLAVALAKAFFQGRTVAGFDMLFLHGLAVYYALDRIGLLTEGETGPMFALDCISAAILLPFSNLFLRARIFLAALRRKNAARGEKNRLRAWVIAVSALIAALLFFGAARILSRADPYFAQRIGRFLAFDVILPGDLPLTLLLSLPAGCYLFGLIGGAIQRGKPSFSAERVRCAAEKARVVPDALAGVLLASFLLLYALFFVFQGSYLFGALRGALPAGFTAAEYARQGFFELSEIVALNFVLLFAVSRTAKTALRAQPVLRLLALMLLAASLLFAGVAASKMALYIARFGLTQLRVLAAFCMLLLFVWSCLAVVGLFRPFRAVRTGLLLAAVLFSLLCLCNPDARIVEINLMQYRSARIDVLDAAYLGQDCGAADDPVRFYRQLNDAGYFAEPRTKQELLDAFGPYAERALDDGSVACVWTNRRGESLAARPSGKAGMTLWLLPADAQ